jgi:hypothetical protein
MTYELYQEKMAEQIVGLQEQKQLLENILGRVDIDFDNPETIVTENRLRAVSKKLFNLEQIAYYIVTQEDELLKLRELVHQQRGRIIALQDMNTRLALRANAAQAVAKLHQSKWNSLERQVDAWGEQILTEINQQIQSDTNVK